MKTAEELISRMGKKGFVDFVTKNQKNGKTGAQRDRGIKGRVKAKYCSHGVWVMEDYIDRLCVGCHGVSEKDVKIHNLLMKCYYLFPIFKDKILKIAESYRVSKASIQVSYGKLADFRPSFNLGLGCWVESRSEERRIAKSMGLEEAG